MLRARPILSTLLAVLAIASGSHAQDAEPDLIRAARPVDPRPLGVGRTIPDLALTTLDGQQHTVSSLLAGKKALALICTGATCPMSTQYGPRLADLERTFSPRAIAFAYINSVQAETRQDMQAQIKRFTLRAPYIPDRDQAACKALGVHTTTEVFLLDPARTLQYRGAIDDQHAIGASLPAPRATYLIDALEALLAGQAPRIRATFSPGCLVSVGEGFAATPDGPPNYSARIAHILAASCVSCHRPGGAAPFPLDTYDAATGRARMLEAVVNDNLMPPWHGAPRPPDADTPFLNDRSLPAADRAALLAWLRSDRPRGDADADPPPLPPLSRTWAIGEPDHSVTSSGFRLPAQGGLQHARLIAAFTPTDDRWASAIELRPVESGSVHHALVWLLSPGDELPRPEALPANLELIAAYSPGDSVIRYPPRTARRIAAGSIFIVDLYAMPMGKEIISALRIGLKWSIQPEQRVRSASALAATIGPSSTATLNVPASAPILALRPYATPRCTKFQVVPATTAAAALPLIDAPHPDTRFIIRYEFADPRPFPAGPLALRATFNPDAAPGPPGSGGADDALLLTADYLEPISEQPRRPDVATPRVP